MTTSTRSPPAPRSCTALGARDTLDDSAWRAARAYNGAPAYADAVLA